MMMLAALVFFCAISLSNASWGWGLCKRFDFVTDADLDKYYGTWYHIVVDSTFYWSKGASCVRGEYSEVEGKDYFQAVNSVVKDGEWKTYTAKVRGKKNGSLEVKFSFLAPWSDYEIIDTDYDKYSIIHYCDNYLFFHHSVNFIIARKPNYKPTQSQIDSIIELGTKEKDILYYDQTDCPPFPGDN